MTQEDQEWGLRKPYTLPCSSMGFPHSPPRSAPVWVPCSHKSCQQTSSSTDSPLHRATCPARNLLHLPWDNSPIRHPPALAQGPPGAAGDLCSTVELPGDAGAQQPHHGLHHDFCLEHPLPLCTGLGVSAGLLSDSHFSLWLQLLSHNKRLFSPLFNKSYQRYSQCCWWAQSWLAAGSCQSQPPLDPLDVEEASGIWHRNHPRNLQLPKPCHADSIHYFRLPSNFILKYSHICFQKKFNQKVLQLHWSSFVNI